MKKNVSLLVIISFLLVLVSCTTDAYDKGEGDYSLMQADMAELHADANKQIVAADTDEGERLVLTNPFTANWVTTADSTYRAYIYYNKLDGGQAEVLGVGTVLVLRPRREKEPKTDPTGLESVWLSTNRRYLNVALLIKVGTPDGGEELHQTLGAVADTLLRHDDGTTTLQLRLYHDQGGMPEYYTQRTYVSIPLNDLPADSVGLRVNTYDGWRERVVRISPN